MNCLAIVDMQKDFNPDEDTINYIKEFLINNSKKYKLIFTIDEHDPDSYDGYQESKIFLSHCVKGTVGAEIVDDLRIFKEDENSKVIKKDTFGSYELANYLWEANYFWELCRAYEALDTVTLMGVCTDICVLNNALLLRNILPGTRIIVDAAGCNGTSPKMHKCALH